MIWGSTLSAGISPLFLFFQSTVITAIYHIYLEPIMLPPVDELYKDAMFIFQLDPVPVYTAKGSKSWLMEYL